ncbi:chemotaxis-specific protein-glutamate methyltransferase CheB [Rhodocyclaceae bacterium]
MSKIRVVIADDSSLARGLLRSFLEGESDIEVVGEAANGQQAVELVRELKPNLVTMDLEMPVMNGMAAIEEIMCSKAVPILVVSSIADAQNALEAVAHGALEVVAKPEYTPQQAADFVAKVRMLAGVSVITRMRSRHFLLPAIQTASVALADSATLAAPVSYQQIFAIASSTGGPQALAQILPALPADFACPVLIAQHISDGFAQGMADWLGSLCKLPVRLGREGDLIAPATVYISPSEKHLAVAPNRRLTLRERGATDLYRPSCDVLLESIASVFGSKAIGIILTGMGHDGAAGLAAIRAAGGTTVGQDEASSVIYGMNRVAIEQGAGQQVLPLGAIADAMIESARRAPSHMAWNWT